MFKILKYYLPFLVFMSCHSKPENSTAYNDASNDGFVVVDEHVHSDGVSYYTVYSGDTSRVTLAKFCDSLSNGNKESFIEIYNSLSETPSFIMLDGFFGTPVSAAKYKYATYEKSESNNGGLLTGKYGQVLYGAMTE